ncbi:MAG: glucose-1-phosphate thymidylyltransferase [Actinobacteria bacterium]|nr:MAG: glucose-1-phosphate thymidylyltransferase [Actinomycetota bacterium]
MKGLILSGGSGTRLRPITFTRAKQLVPVANKPILFYAIEAVRDCGIDEIGIVVGDTKDEVIATVGDGSAFGVAVSYIEQEAPLGLAHAVKISEGFIGGDPFVMYLGDNLIKEGIVDLVEEFQRTRPNCQILLAHVDNPEMFGVAELAGGKVVRLVEKPKEPASDLALVGVYMFDSTIFEAVNAIKPSWRNELEITDAIQYLINKGLVVHPHVIGGWWKDTGRLEDLLEANMIMLDTLEARNEGTIDAESSVSGKVVVEAGAEVIGSVVRGPAIIGMGSRIESSYVGPFTSIHHGVTIERSEIEHSIVMPGACIRGIGRISDSLLGVNVRVCRTERKPESLRMMVGDNSEVEVV